MDFARTNQDLSLAAQTRNHGALSSLDASVSGISSATTPANIQQIYESSKKLNGLSSSNPLHTRLGPKPASFHEGTQVRDLTPTRTLTSDQYPPGGVQQIYQASPANPSKWATEGSESIPVKPPIPGKVRTSAQDHLDLSSHEKANLLNRIRQLEQENYDLQSALQRSQQTPPVVNTNDSLLMQNVQKLWKVLKDFNPSWNQAGIDPSDFRSLNSTDPQKLTAIFDKAIQTVQNEVILVKQANDMHRKYGLSHYCISRLRDLNKQLKHGVEKINTESAKVPVQLQSGNWIYVHKDPEAVVARTEEFLRVWLKKVANLEESPEFHELRADLQ